MSAIPTDIPGRIDRSTGRQRDITRACLAHNILCGIRGGGRPRSLESKTQRRLRLLQGLNSGLQRDNVSGAAVHSTRDGGEVRVDIRGPGRRSRDVGTVTGPARAPAAAMTSATPTATASFRLPIPMLLQVQSELSHVLTVPSQ